MTKEQGQVKDFMVTFGQDCPVKPTVPSQSTRILRVKLLLEEVFELAEASGVNIEFFDGAKVDLDKIQLHALNNADGSKVDLVGVADALADIDYVNLGAANAYGLNLEPFQTEVHRSNMTKLWKKEELEIATSSGYDVKPVGDRYLVRRPDGKVVKSPSYEVADLKNVLNAQV